jgi:8-oxo-dGTP pyrophosphatase MutT (NUDIX family)
MRQAALCVFRRGDTFLVAEIHDPHTGIVLHRPPGGRIEQGENPEDAVRREIREELGITLTDIRALGAIDHVWHWNGRAVAERAWMFLGNPADDERLSRGQTPDVIEADGGRWKTLWRPIQAGDTLPPLCPANLAEFLESLR